MSFPHFAVAQGFEPAKIQAILKANPEPANTPPQALPESQAGKPSPAAPSASFAPQPAGDSLAKPAEPARAVEAVAPKPAPEDLYLSKDPQPTFTAETASLTEAAAQKYLAIVEAGGWPMVPAGVKLLPGTSNAAVVTLRQRLIVTGDLAPEAAQGEAYDASVEDGVKHFQERHGLEQTGAIGGQTLRALNISAIMRYNQLLASAKRLRASKFGFGPRYVTVNIPSANVEAIENGVVVRRYIAVVGKADHASPTVEAKITSINLNPTWTVPASIVKNEVISHMQANPGYLAKEHIRILDQAGTEIDPTSIDWTKNTATAFTLRQDSGTSNSLGTLRIDMPNREAVYMHDTPSKGLFSASVRFQSHGCVRVSKVDELAAWLLENNAATDQPGATGGWNAQTIDAAITLGSRMDVKLAKPVPVAWVYLTGYATPDQIVHFRNDVYDRDNPAEDSASAAKPQQQQSQTASGAKPVAAQPPAAKPVAVTAPLAPMTKSVME